MSERETLEELQAALERAVTNGKELDKELAGYCAEHRDCINTAHKYQQNSAEARYWISNKAAKALNKINNVRERIAQNEIWQGGLIIKIQRFQRNKQQIGTYHR